MTWWGEWTQVERPWSGAEESSGCARCRLEPKLMNRCRPEKMDTKGDGEMSNRILVLEEGKVLDRNARECTVEGEKKRVTRKECKWLTEEFEVGGFMAQKALWNIAKKGGCWMTGEHCLKKRERRLCQIIQGHARRPLSQQLAEGGYGRQGGTMEKTSGEAREEESKSGKREMEGQRERFEVNSERDCRGCLLGLFVVKVLKFFSDPEVEDVGSECEVSARFLVRLVDLTASPDVECNFPAVLPSKFQVNLSVTQTFFFSGKRGVSGALFLCPRGQG